MNPAGHHLSPFSMLLTAAVLSLLGAVTLPLLHIRPEQESETASLQVSFRYADASAHTVETEVTSVIEGSLNTLRGVTGIRSVSREGSGEITVRFKQGTRMDMVRFEAATRIRDIYGRLPGGVSYPVFNSTFTGRRETSILSCALYADSSENELVRYARRHFIPPLARIEGIGNIRIPEAEDAAWTISFHSDRLARTGLSPEDLCRAVSQAFRDDMAGSLIRNDTLVMVRLKASSGSIDLKDLIVSNINGHICRIGEVAEVTRQPATQTSYMRINGLPAISIELCVSGQVNTLRVGRKARQCLDDIRRDLPTGMALRITHDSTEALRREIRQIVRRSVLSLLCLLGFVLLVSRSFRYLSVIFVSLVATLLISVLCYHPAHLTLDLRALSAISISLGMAIDTTIVVADHRTYHRDLRIAGAVTGALLTTVLALLVLSFSAEARRGQLGSFIGVMTVNLCIALAVSLTVVPALLEKMPVTRQEGMIRTSFRHKKRLVRFSERYRRTIGRLRRHRVWLCLILVIGFGLPLHRLPDEIRPPARPENLPQRLQAAGCRVYNRTIGGSWYQIHRRLFEDALGGARHFFITRSPVDPFRPTDTETPALVVSAYLPEGYSILHMNDILREMEGFLSREESIETYCTTIPSATYGEILVNFKTGTDEAVPRELKQRIWTQAVRYGGAVWTVSGGDSQVLTNNVRMERVPYGIYLYGYHYDLLFRYGQQLADSLNSQLRVTDAAVMNGPDDAAGQELAVSYHGPWLAQQNLSARDVRSFLSNRNFTRSLGTLHHDGQSVRVTVAAAFRDGTDLWRLEHEMAEIGGLSMPFQMLGSLEKKATGHDIVRNDQAYELFVGYHFIGPDDQAARLSKEC
ncbi:MAG: efflux RND transporter permease subunit, partial [Bacteroidales bacterium]|nr:efflux RND transporter permease subunit [Bacteroidales bacterium]